MNVIKKRSVAMYIRLVLVIIFIYFELTRDAKSQIYLWFACACGAKLGKKRTAFTRHYSGFRNFERNRNTREVP